MQRGLGILKLFWLTPKTQQLSRRSSGMIFLQATMLTSLSIQGCMLMTKPSQVLGQENVQTPTTR